MQQGLEPELLLSLCRALYRILRVKKENLAG